MARYWAKLIYECRSTILKIPSCPGQAMVEVHLIRLFQLFSASMLIIKLAVCQVKSLKAAFNPQKEVNPLIFELCLSPVCFH